MRYTETFKALAKKGFLQDIDRLLFEMPPVRKGPWIDFMVAPPPQGIFADINANIDFIVELIKGNTPNKEEVVQKLLSHMTVLQGDGNIKALLDLLNSKLSEGRPIEGASYTLSRWAIENAPYLLDMNLVQQDLYETQVKEMVVQAIQDDDVEALQNLMARHAKTLPDQLQPSMLESMKEYIPLWVKSMISSPMAWLLGDRVKLEICASIDNPATSFECQRILAPYRIEQKALGYSEPHSEGTTSGHIASDIAKFKLTDNPRAMRALRISQLIDTMKKGDLNAFNQKLDEVKDVLDMQSLYKIIHDVIPPGMPAHPERKRATDVMVEKLLETTQPLYREDKAGLDGLWQQFMADGRHELLNIQGVMPAEVSYRELKNLIKTHAEKGDIEALEFLVPYTKQQKVSITFGDNELNLAGLDKKQTSAVVELLDNLTIATKRPAAMVSGYQKKPQGPSAEPQRAEPEERARNAPKK
ncbi:MAG: hypothetical protein AB7I18_12820 [Candidatus Berkiella sp.]